MVGQMKHCPNGRDPTSQAEGHNDEAGWGSAVLTTLDLASG